MEDIRYEYGVVYSEDYAYVVRRRCEVVVLIGGSRREVPGIYHVIAMFSSDQRAMEYAFEENEKEAEAWREN